jgi:isopentenyldiphosphate isomerase/intracellular septation protein A
MDKKTILKNFTIGFIPLLVFILADELFGTTIGLFTAVVTGLLEFAYYYFRFRQVEGFVLFDVALIVILGGISILLHNDIFFKLKPALIEIILVAMLGVHGFSKTPLLLIMSKRYMKGLTTNDLQLQMMRRLSRVLFIVLMMHTALIVYAAYFMSTEAWGFISGGLFYIIFGLILAGQYLYMRFFKSTRPKFIAGEGEEWFDLVTPDGKVIGQAPRRAVHGDPSLLHPVVHVHVFNRNGQLFLQKRSPSKDVQPGKWDTAVGGHIHAGEDIQSALQREAAEELGITRGTFHRLYSYVMRNNFESELVHTFRIVDNGPFKINREEIEIGRFWKIQEIEANLGRDLFTPNFEQEFELLKKYYLQKKHK